MLDSLPRTHSLSYGWGDMEWEGGYRERGSAVNIMQHTASYIRAKSFHP